MLAEARVLIEQSRVHHNTVRPLSALGYRLPAPEVILSGVPVAVTPPDLAGSAAALVILLISKNPVREWSWVSDTSEQQSAHADVDHGFGDVHALLVVMNQTAPAGHPANRTFPGLSTTVGGARTRRTSLQEQGRDRRDERREAR